MKNWERCYIGLGSNLGDRSARLRRACLRLARTPGVRVLRTSAVYETAPLGYTEQPPFLNAVAEVETLLGPVQLALALQVAERELGRSASVRWGPREIDLDLLLYGGRALDRRGLTIPHRSMHERAFVLAPLADLYPDYVGPEGETIDVVLTRLRAQQTIQRLGDRLLPAPLR